MRKDELGELIYMITATVGLLCGCASNVSDASALRINQSERALSAGECISISFHRYSGDTKRIQLEISRDGTIELPLISERVRIAGLTPNAAGKVICNLYQPDGPTAVTVLPCSSETISLPAKN